MSKTEINSDLVSIIMPAYNCEKFIGDAINSVINQMYRQWELIIVDDFSTDNTLEIINEYIKMEDRIKLYSLNKNSGAALARNKAIKMAKGKYIAFLDSDDLWYSNKLESQLLFMKQNNIDFSCTSYSKIDEKSNLLGKIVGVKQVSNYNDLLKKCPGNSTVIYNNDKLGKFFIKDIKKRNDYLMWLQVIKKSDYLYGLSETLSSHRIREGSLSENKSDLVKYHWFIYNNIEKLPIIKSLYLIVYWIMKSIIKKPTNSNMSNEVQF